MMITAQDLYDRREVLGEIGGIDLHELFRELVGTPSPSGRVPITIEAIESLAARMPTPYAGTFGGERRFLDGVLGQSKRILVYALDEYPGQFEAYEEGVAPLRPCTYAADCASIREARDWMGSR